MIAKKLFYFCVVLLFFLLSSIYSFGDESIEYNKIPIANGIKWNVITFESYDESFFDDYDLYSDKYFRIIRGEFYFYGYAIGSGFIDYIWFEVAKVVEVKKKVNNKRISIYNVYFVDNPDYYVIIEPLSMSQFKFIFMKKYVHDKKEVYNKCIEFLCEKD